MALLLDRRRTKPGQAAGAAAKPEAAAASKAAAANKATGWAKVAQKPKPKQKPKRGRTTMLTCPGSALATLPL